MPTLRLAFDTASERYYDPDGRLHVRSSPISKAMVNPYYGQEIPGWQALGLQPYETYRLLRDPVELERGAETFARLNILSDHVPVTVASMRADPEQKQLIAGNIGSNVIFDSPYLKADLCIFDATAIANIENKTVCELSCGYRYVPVMESGEFEGEAYDGRMTQIVGNHLALVTAGRAGPDVVVADSQPKEMTMAGTKFGKALLAQLCLASPVLAADKALPGLVINLKRADFKPAELKPKILAMDAALDPERLGVAFDAMADSEDDPIPKPPMSKDADPEETEEERKKRETKEKDDKPAMDAAAINKAISDGVNAGVAAATAAMQATNEAMRIVRPTVGEIVVTMDSAAAVFGFALDKLGVKHDGITDPKALRTIYEVSAAKAAPVTPAPVAMDAAGLTRFGIKPGRFNQAFF